MLERLFEGLLNGNKRTVLLRAALLFVAIALLDWSVVGEIPLGFLYLLPMLLVGSVLAPRQIIASAAVCTLMAELFDDLTWLPRLAIPRDVLYLAAFLGVGFFVRQVNRNRHAAQLHLQQVEQESSARREAEHQLLALVESSPAAILTADVNGVVLMANQAAHRMLAVPPQQLVGKAIDAFLPSLANVARATTARHLFRTVMQARGQRADGEGFLAEISFSTYSTNAGTRLTAMVLDASEDLRTQEVAGLHQLMAGSRLAVSALSHEIRNICSAIAVVHQNLQHAATLADNKDFDALGSLVLALERIAGANLQQTASPIDDQAAEVDLTTLLEELKIVISPQLQEEHIAATWQLQPSLPMVWADRSTLMQVFLNLVTNSVRALNSPAAASPRRLNIAAHCEDRNQCRRVLVQLTDNGGGVEHPEHLFRPFQAGAKATGLGLYLSRAFLRAFSGELRHLPATLEGHPGACFVVDLVTAPAAEAK